MVKACSQQIWWNCSEINWDAMNAPCRIDQRHISMARVDVYFRKWLCVTHRASDQMTPDFFNKNNKSSKQNKHVSFQLHKHSYDTGEALQSLVKTINPKTLDKRWSEEDAVSLLSPPPPQFTRPQWRPHPYYYRMTRVYMYTPVCTV